jgi:hypothetical protein
MNRLIQSGLIFGNLIHVDSPTLVERYNRVINLGFLGNATLPRFHFPMTLR